LVVSPILWLPSADRHGIDIADAMWAMSHALVNASLVGQSRHAGQPDPDLWIGPQRDPQAPLLEVIATVLPDRTLTVFHVNALTEQ
jgi:hypothetical protein